MGLYDGLQEIGPTTPPPAAPKAPPSLYDGLPVLGASQTPQRTASGAVESLRAGFQASAPGLAWRGKLPDLITDPATASWWERALTGVAQVGAELPLMVAGAVAGAPAGAAIGTAIAPGVGTAAGSLLGAGAGMGIVPGAIRESLMQAYKSGEIKTGADWWAAIKEVATTAGREGALNAAAMGAGAVAARAVGSAIAPKIGQTMTQAAGIRTIVGADLATQIAAMPTIPAALQGRLPDAQEFLDAAILIGGLHVAGTTAARVANIYARTGKTPAQVVADAQANPEIAAEIARQPDPQDVYVPPTRAEMLTIQENLFTESARLGEMEAKAAAAPLTDAERLDFNALKSRVLDLERQLDRATPLEAPAGPATFTADQFEAARALATTRLEALNEKANGTKDVQTTGPDGTTVTIPGKPAQYLTDAERAERVFLANSKDKPEALAAHFKLEPQAQRRITAEQFDASAQRVHDEVLRQVKEADEARRASGLTPLGDEHAAAVAALVRARLRTRAQRLGMLPEDLYKERPVRIEDETAPEVAAAEAAIPADAPRFSPPEVDLFGDPVVVTNAPRYAVENKATVELPLANLILSKEVPQFKHAADQQGVVVPLGGRFDRTGVGPIQVWERRDGTLEVISGRHRLDLARRSGEETIPAQVHREADGFDARQAATLDAELNIREEQGSTADYAQYFKDSGKTREAADELGLLARAKGRAGFSIARDASPDLLAAHRAGGLSDEAALAISSTAPGSDRLQALGIAMVNEGKSILIAVNTMRAVDLMAAERMMAGTQGDIFGFDDSAMKEASTMAKKASAKQRQIGEQISAVSGASKRPELAAKMGVNVEDPAAVQLKIVELRQEQYLWDNWPLYPELVAKLRGENLKQGRPPQRPKYEMTAEGPTLRTPAIALSDPWGSTAGNGTSIHQHTVTDKTGATIGEATLGWKGDQVVELLNIHFDAQRKGSGEAVIKAILSHNNQETQVRVLDIQPDARLFWEKMGVSFIDKNGATDGVLTKGEYESRRGSLGIGNDARTDQGVAGVSGDSTGKDAGGTDGDAPGTPGRKLYQDTIDEFPMLPETPAEGAARDREAAAEAVRKIDGVTPTKLFQDLRETWYKSALGEAVQAANIKSAPAKGWQDFLKGQVAKGGVKADEIKWSGIEEWLQLQEGKVTKEQVADYLATNGVKVEEVMTGGKTTPNLSDPQIASEMATLKEAGWLVDQDPDGGSRLGFLDPEGDIIDAADLRALVRDEPSLDAVAGAAENIEAYWYGMQGETPTKFSQYQLPGGQNYRELLLTLPTEKAPTLPEGFKVVKARSTQGESMWSLVGPNSRSGDMLPLRPHATEAEAIEVAARILTSTGNRSGAPTFQSSHFDTPNILAHIRFNERTDAEGKKVLFIEEFQSDWAQKGKKEGFNEPTTGVFGGTVQAKPGTVPAAPFVGKTDAWVSLAIKRMIAYAAQNGFDRVAWTRGEQQVERYTGALRKAVDAVEWTKTKDGVQLVGWKGKGPTDLSAEDHAAYTAEIDAVEQLRDRGGQISRHEAERRINRIREAYGLDRYGQLVDRRAKVVDTTEKEDALSDAIGKAMAEKIISDPNQTGTIEGDGIKIDSTGMAGFYDKIVPKVANEVLRKLGGDKVSETTIGEATPEFVTRQQPDGNWAVFNRAGDLLAELDELTGRPFRTERQAQQALIDDDLPVGATRSTQQSFDITPPMRDKAMHGLPLFQQHRGSYDVAENMITIMQGADKSTVVHELGHSWLEEMKIDAKREGVPDQIRQDWEVLRRELAIGEDGTISRASHEQFARSVERYLADGDAPSIELRSVFQRFKEWLIEIYRDLANLNVNINPELRAVLDRMLATDEQIKAAREMDIPVAYVPEALEIRAAEIVPPPAARRKIEPGFKAELASMEPYADELPRGPGEAPDNTHVNYAYINSPTDVKLAMQKLAEIDQANIQAQRGGTDGVKSWAEANAEQARYLNDILGGGPDTLHLFEPRDPDAPHVDVRLGILKKLAVGAAKDSARLRDVVLQKGHDATVREQLEYLGSIERARMIQAEFLGERASIARALNALKDTTEGTGEIGRMLEAIGTGDEGKLFQAARTPEQEQAYLKQKLDEIMIQYRGKSVLDIARLHKEIGTLKGSFKFADEVTKATKWEMIVEGWKAGLLSGPVTHTTNLFGTGAFQVMRAPVDALAVIIGTARGASPGMGESNRASMSEITARLTGMLGGAQDGLKVAYATFRQDEATMKTESHREAIPGRAGELIRIPLRLMGAEDALIGTMYERGELRTLAIRTAFDEQLNPGTREFAARVDQLIDHPTDAMTETAAAARERMTFNAPLGEKGVALQLFVGKWNLQWMIPFIRTPINIAKELARMSPFAPIVGEWRADIAKGGVARDRAIAEIGLGTAIMGVTMAYAFAGNISGGGSPDPGKNRGKAGVWQPYSILVGDTWYEYARIQPTGTLMGLAADIAVAWDHMTEEEKDKVPKLLAGAFAQAVTNQTFLQGITNFINATSDPTRFAPRFFQQLAGSMVPNVIGQPTTMADPFVREVNGMLDAIQARIPGMRQDLLPKRDWLGEPVPTKERLGVVLPSRMQEISDDKVRLEAARLDISMAAPPKKTHIGKGTGKLGDVKLTPEEMDKFEQVGGQFAHGILANIVNAPGYDQIPDLVKRRIFSRVLTASHKLAAVQALPMEKRIALIQTISEKVAAELTPEEQ